YASDWARTAQSGGTGGGEAFIPEVGDEVLVGDLFDDPSRTVTVRAEMSRIRRYLGELLQHRPYRFRDDAEVDVILPEDPSHLLPQSMAPAVTRKRNAVLDARTKRPGQG
ncbi:phage baseplate assembly protein V, partial [Streptomyces olivaceoviridis]